jgi:hypothetical protein
MLLADLLELRLLSLGEIQLTKRQTESGAESVSPAAATRAATRSLGECRPSRKQPSHNHPDC